MPISMARNPFSTRNTIAVSPYRRNREWSNRPWLPYYDPRQLIVPRPHAMTASTCLPHLRQVHIAILLPARFCGRWSDSGRSRLLLRLLWRAGLVPFQPVESPLDSFQPFKELDQQCRPLQFSEHLVLFLVETLELEQQLGTLLVEGIHHVRLRLLQRGWQGLLFPLRFLSSFRKGRVGCLHCRRIPLPFGGLLRLQQRLLGLPARCLGRHQRLLCSPACLSLSLPGSIPLGSCLDLRL